MENIIVRGTTKCSCGREFNIHDINGLKRIDDNKFYGGVVKHYSETKCPVCRKEIILLLKQVGQTYEVINTAERHNKNVINVVKSANKNVEIPTTTENKTEKTTSNEIICPECGKVCKSKSGLTSHMKTHNK